MMDGDSYLVKDISGKEVRLYVDKSTKLDGNITPGDRIVARLDRLVTTGHASSINKR